MQIIQGLFRTASKGLGLMAEAECRRPASNLEHRVLCSALLSDFVKARCDEEIGLLQALLQRCRFSFTWRKGAWRRGWACIKAGGGQTAGRRGRVCCCFERYLGSGSLLVKRGFEIAKKAQNSTLVAK